MIRRHPTTLRALALAAMACFAMPLMPATVLGQEEAPPAPTEAAAEAAPAAPDAAAVAADTLAYFNNVAPTGPLAGLPGPGHNAFLMVCAALVLFMTLPGLALFYGGLVRKKSILSVMAQCLGLAGLVTIMWFAFGYSMVFGEHDAEGAPSWAGIFGDFSKYAFLKDVGGAPNTNYTAWPSHSTFAMYQLMFAIITPALIVGAIAERMKFSAIMIFCAIWMVLVYFPMAHMVWGFDGLFNGVWNGGAKIPSIDFAGGTVVHMTSGWSALVLCLILGKRLGFGKEKMSPHNMVLCMVGTGMLWVGWYGFNAGSALAADGLASQAFMTTTIAAAVAAFTWGLIEKVLRGKVSVLGLCSGAVAGLVVITPAAGFVTAQSAFIMGILAGVVPYFACTFLKSKMGYDDSLDTFGIHGVGGTLGALLTAVFANSKVNPNLVSDAYAKVNGLQAMFNPETGKATSALLINHLCVAGTTIVLSVVVTAVVALIIKAVIGLRPTPESETAGLDITEHGEEGYDY